MPLTPRSRLVNPRLGNYFGIASSLLVGLTLLLILLEAMGTSAVTLGLACAAGPVVLYVAIAAASATDEPADYLACGRRVPAFFNGLVSAVAVIGGAGMLAMTGALFLSGFDALCLLSGMAAGLVVLALMIAPFLRKCGAPTLAGFLGMRFSSSRLRMIAALASMLPLGLLLVAEVKAAAWVASLLAATSLEAMVGAVALVLLAIVGPGGMRSQTWSSAAMSIAVVLALLTPVTVLAVTAINLPLPQLSHGVVLRALVRAENLHAVPTATAPLALFDLPGLGATALSGRFATPFSSVGALGFIAATFVVMLGIAASPSLASRCGTAPSVYEVRKSIGWAVFVLAVMLTTISAVATFLRDAILAQVAGVEFASVPAWFQDLLSMGFAETAARSGRVSVGNIRFYRDAALFALPTVAGQPYTLTALALAGALAAALVAASQAAIALGNVVALDLAGARIGAQAGPRRLHVARGCVLATVVAAALAAVLVDFDPLQALIHAWSLSAAALFPVLVLSVWWKGLNGWGAMIGVGAGLSLALLGELGGYAGWLAPPIPIVGLGAAAAGLVAAIAISTLTSGRSREVAEFVRDVRVPGGETIYDREQRLARARERHGL